MIGADNLQYKATPMHIPRSPAAARGFTLIEILVVVVILGILAAIVVPRVMEHPGEARQVRAKQDIQAILTALNTYKLDNYTYPTTEQGLDALVQVELESVYDHVGAVYDAAYFSASFMLLPDPEAALRHVMSLVVPSGRIYFTQTFQDKRAPLLEKAKPLLVKVTTVDFGKVPYEEDFYRAADSAGMEILEMETLTKGMGRSSRLVVGRRIA
jgi:prepilin-type N-terminal cleavage/methylation domain-containing protein